MAHKFPYAQKKKNKLLVERHATHAQLLGHWRNGEISKRFWVDQTGDTQQQPDQDITEDASTPQTSCGGGILRCEGFHYNKHCLLLRPSLSNVPKLSIV
jgi:hypothetical protein